MVGTASEMGYDLGGKYREKVRFEVVFEDREIVAGTFSSKNYTEDF